MSKNRCKFPSIDSLSRSTGNILLDALNLFALFAVGVVLLVVSYAAKFALSIFVFVFLGTTKDRLEEHYKDLEED